MHVLNWETPIREEINIQASLIQALYWLKAMHLESLRAFLFKGKIREIEHDSA